MVDMDVIETERFWLRKVTLDDSKDIFGILSDSDTIRYLNLNSISNICDVEELVEEYLRENAEGNKYPFAIIEKKSSAFVGVFLIKLDLYDEDCFEFTVYIDKKFWNQGVYSEVLPQMVKFSFEKIGTGNFRGFVMQSNASSARVLLKNKFILEKTFEVEGLPDMIESYLMTKEFYYANYKNK